MNLATFFEKFDLFADAPDAVAKMRELVLELAVQGKLVEQNERDEPASELLKRAAASNPTAVSKAHAGFEERHKDEANNSDDLPPGWTWACNAMLGNPSPRNEADDAKLVAFAPMHLIPTDYRARFVPETRPWGEVKKGYTHFADGDIVVAKITPCFQNGKACVMTKLPGGIGAGTTELHVLRPYPRTVIPLYMLLAFRSPGFVEGGVATFTGTAGKQRVSNDYFKFRPIPLPPLAEQKRIVRRWMS